mgnify:CR=1 FL=1
MYFLQDGLGAYKGCKHIGKILAILFSIFALFASFGIGNMTQVNTIAGTINTAIAGFVPTTEAQQVMIAWVVSVICALVCAIVLFILSLIKKADQKIASK